MFERCLNEAELILRTQREPTTTVHEVWEEINRRAKIKGFDVASMSDFSAMLEGDKRFQIIPASIKTQEEEADGELVDIEMEDLGFYSEDRVKLRARRIVETVITEDDEEIGSIKRRAFVSSAAKEKNIGIIKKTIVIKKSDKKTKQKTKLNVKRTKSIPRKKSRLRGKK
jgi:hypothetical protein